MERSQTKRMEAKKWCLGALSAFPIALIIKKTNITFPPPAGDFTFFFAIILTYLIVILFCLYELVLATQEGITDDRVRDLEKKVSEAPKDYKVPNKLLYRSGYDDLKRDLKIKKFIGALTAQDIFSFYGFLFLINIIANFLIY